MFRSVNIVGLGRVGTAVKARLEERGIEVTAGLGGSAPADLVLLCVDDPARGWSHTRRHAYADRCIAALWSDDQRGQRTAQSLR